MKSWMLVFPMLLAAATAYGVEPSPFEVDEFTLDFSGADFLNESSAEPLIWLAVDAICDGLSQDGPCLAGQCTEIPWQCIQAACPAKCKAATCGRASCKAATAARACAKTCPAQKCAGKTCTITRGPLGIAVTLATCESGKCACGDKCQCGKGKGNKCACGKTCQCGKSQCQVKCAGGQCKIAKCGTAKCGTAKCGAGNCAVAKCGANKCACKSKCGCGTNCKCGDGETVAQLKRELQAAHQHIEYRAHLAEFRAQAMEREQAMMFELMEAKAAAAASQAALEQQVIAQHQQQALLGQIVKLAHPGAHPRHVAQGQLQERLQQLAQQNAQLRQTIEELRLHVEHLARQPSETR